MAVNATRDRATARGEVEGDVPWQQLGNTIDRVVGDAFQRLAKVQVRIDSVQAALVSMWQSGGFSGQNGA
jgi:hypothetical protein